MRQSKLLRLKIAKIVKRARFPNHEKNRVIVLCLLRAIELKRSYEKLALQAVKKPVGRPKKAPYMPILSSAIFRAWRIGTGRKATVSKRIAGIVPNNFVQFATEIYWLEGIANVIDHLDDYRSLGNKLERQAWVWRLSQK